MNAEGQSKIQKILEKSKSNSKNQSSTDKDKCIIHLAECYNLSKKVEALTSEVDCATKSKSELELQIKELIESQERLKSTYESSLSKMERIVETLSLENKILSNNHEYSGLVNFYETKIEDINSWFNDQLKSYMSFSRTFNSAESFGSREEVYKKTVKKLHINLEEVQAKLSLEEKKTRAFQTKKEFFSKYIVDSEKKITSLSKEIDKTNARSKIEYQKLKETIKDLEIKINEYESKLIQQLQANQLLKDNISQLTKEENTCQHQDPKCENAMKSKEESNYESKLANSETWGLTSNQNTKREYFVQTLKTNVNQIKEASKERNSDKNSGIDSLFENIKEESNRLLRNYEELNPDDHTKLENNTIIKLLKNIRSLILSLFEETGLTELDFKVIDSILSDISKYVVCMLKSFNKLTINQYHLINLMCEFKDKSSFIIKSSICENDKNLVVPIKLFGSFLNDAKNICFTILGEKNPKKYDFIVVK